MRSKSEIHLERLNQLCRLAAFIVAVIVFAVGAFFWVVPWIWVGGLFGLSQNLTLIFLILPLPQMFVAIMLWPIIGIPYWIKTGESAFNWIYAVVDRLYDWVEKKLIDKYGSVE